jgi:hypothetical protein
MEPKDGIVLLFVDMAVLYCSESFSNTTNTMHDAHGPRRAQTFVKVEEQI